MIGGQQCWDLFSDISKNSNPPLPPRTKLNFGYHGWKWLLFLAKTLLGLGAGGDDRSKVENYRGIILLSALSKLFTSILNNRLYDYMVQKGIWKAEQGGFRKMHGTVDSIFTLKMLIDKYLKSKPQKHRNLLFSCFVDFRKAFDCIPRQKLFNKLRKGVQGRFPDILISMYSNDKSAVKIDNKLTESFTCHAGVKQGCMLSPTLFNFYLSDLPKFLNTASSTDIMLSDKYINCL